MKNSNKHTYACSTLHAVHRIMVMVTFYYYYYYFYYYYVCVIWGGGCFVYIACLLFYALAIYQDSVSSVSRRSRWVEDRLIDRPPGGASVPGQCIVNVAPTGGWLYSHNAHPDTPNCTPRKTDTWRNGEASIRALAEWVEHPPPVLRDWGIGTSCVRTMVGSNQWLKNLYLSLPSQALSIIRIGQGLVNCDWAGYQVMVLAAYFPSGVPL